MCARGTAASASARAGVVGHAHADGAEHGAQRRDALVDVAGAQELLGGAAAQIERLGGRGGLGRGEVGRRRLGAAAGVGQRVGELHAQVERRVAVT